MVLRAAAGTHALLSAGDAFCVDVWAPSYIHDNLRDMEGGDLILNGNYSPAAT